MLTATNLPRIRTGAVGFSFLLHLAAGIFIWKLGNESPVTVFSMLAASISLIPIVLLAENLKKMAIYLFVAVSPVPIGLFLLLSFALMISLIANGTGDFSFTRILIIFQSTVLVTVMLLSITWHYLLGALAVRFIGQAWLKRRRNEKL